MYSLCLKKDFIARHYLIGGDWGMENQPHAHHYALELRLEAGELDGHGYLVDLVNVEERLNHVIARYRDAMLNDLEPFAGLNPSLERFARLLWDDLTAGFPSIRGNRVTVRLWENESAWAQWSGRPE